jgi:hypothetical protein
MNATKRRARLTPERAELLFEEHAELDGCPACEDVYDFDRGYPCPLGLRLLRVIDPSEGEQ